MVLRVEDNCKRKDFLYNLDGDAACPSRDVAVRDRMLRSGMSEAQ